MKGPQAHSCQQSVRGAECLARVKNRLSLRRGPHQAGHGKCHMVVRSLQCTVPNDRKTVLAS